MNTTAISLIRIAILLVLATLGLFLILGEEGDENIWFFLVHVICDKALGFGCIYAMCKLYERWRMSDRWIARFEAWCANVEEK